LTGCLEKTTRTNHLRAGGMMRLHCASAETIVPRRETQFPPAVRTSHRPVFADRDTTCTASVTMPNVERCYRCGVLGSVCCAGKTCAPGSTCRAMPPEGFRCRN
jgi:hypothetical protein